MKKSIILLSALVLLVAGCSDLTLNDDEVSEDSSSTSETTTESEETPDESSPTTPTDPGEGGLPEGATEMTFKDQNEVVEEAAGIMYFWNEQDTNHVDIDLAYNLGSTSHIEYSVEADLTPVWYGIQLFLELSAEEKTSYGLTTGDEYTVSLSLKSSVSGTITINGVETDITAGDNTISVTSTTRIGHSTEVWDDGTTSMITLYTPTLLIQLGKEDGDFLGAATIEVSDLSFAKTETSDTTEAITASGLSNVNGVDSVTDGKMHYWMNSATVSEATHYINEDKYVIDYSNATGEWWGFQIFWMLDETQLSTYELTEGTMYTLTFKLNSSVAGTIAVNNDTIAINQGSNDISTVDTVNSSSTEHATFHIWMGSTSTGLINAAKVEITEISFTPYVSTGYSNSLTVDLVNATPASAYAEEASVPHDGKLYYWNDQNWCGSSVSVTTFAYQQDQSGFVITYTSSGQCWYGLQIWLDVPDDSPLRSASVYEVDLEMSSTVAGNITVNKQVVSLASGSNSISVTSTGASGTTFQIQFGEADANGSNAGTSMISAGTFVITSLVFKY